MDRHGQSGYMICNGDTLINWRSTKQPKVALSNREAEFRSITSTAVDIDWIASIFIELGIKVCTPSTI